MGTDAIQCVTGMGDVADSVVGLGNAQRPRSLKPVPLNATAPPALEAEVPPDRKHAAIRRLRSKGRIVAAAAMSLSSVSVIGVALLQILPSWRWVFGLVALPGLATAVLLSRAMRNDAPGAGERGSSRVPEAPRRDWSELLRLRAVVVNTLNMVCLLTILISLAVFVPNYLTDHLHLGLSDMSKVASGLGLGSVVGTVLLPILSDRLGRRSVMVGGAVVVLASVLVFSRLGAGVGPLFCALFVAACATTGNMTINVGPLTSAGVPRALVASATGVVTGVGEIVGGAVAPALIGTAAQRLGIEIVPVIAGFAAMAALAVTILFVQEPWRGALD